MGILLTESFQRFGIGTFDRLGSGVLRPIQTDGEWREFTGYYNIADATNGAINNADGYGTVGIYPDPVIASKKRLGLQIEQPTLARNFNHLYGLERLFTTPRTKYTIGFLARINSGSTMQANPTTVYQEGMGFEICAAGRSRFSLTTTQQAMYILVGGTDAARQGTFGMDNFGRPTISWTAMNPLAVSLNNPPTFRMKGTSDPNGAGIQLKYDTDAFFECEIDTVAQTIKVWVDDIYAGTVPWNATYDAAYTNGFQIRLFRGTATSYNSTVVLSSIMISDIYTVDMTDGQSPNGRLGKTTRVMGEAPDTDVSIKFARPDGFTSNADVINDPIAGTAIPAAFLTGEGAGTEDVYQTAQSSIAAFAGTVYGVTLRARYQNASGSSHTLAITADDGTTKTDNSLGSVAAGSGLQMKSVILNKTPSGTAWTPQKAAALKYGFKIVN